MRTPEAREPGFEKHHSTPGDHWRKRGVKRRTVFVLRKEADAKKSQIGQESGTEQSELCKLE